MAVVLSSFFTGTLDSPETMSLTDFTNAANIHLEEFLGYGVENLYHALDYNSLQTVGTVAHIRLSKRALGMKPYQMPPHILLPN